MHNVYTLCTDVLYRHNGIDFVWDANKAASNATKHGVRFERACEVFFDPPCCRWTQVSKTKPAMPS